MDWVSWLEKIEAKKTSQEDWSMTECSSYTMVYGRSEGTFGAHIVPQKKMRKFEDKMKKSCHLMGWVSGLKKIEVKKSSQDDYSRR